MPQKIIIFLLLIQILRINSNDCYTYLIEDTPNFYTCAGSQLLTAAALTPIVKTPSKQLTVAVTLHLTNNCGNLGNNNFFTVSINTSSGRKRVMMAHIQSTGNFAFRSEDSTVTIKEFVTTTTTDMLEPFNVFFSVDMTPGANMFSVGWLLKNEQNVVKTYAVSYGSDWVFDSSLRISLCSDYDGTTLFDSYACYAQNLKVAYSIYFDSSIINYANSATLLADYKLNEGKGTTLADSKKSLAPITLTPGISPTWSSDTGLEFTSPTEFVTIPSFTASQSGLAIEASVSFLFYMKMDIDPGTEDPIFTYYCDSMGIDVFTLYLTPGGRLKSKMQGSTDYGSYFLVPGEWTQVYVGIIYGKGNLGAAVVQVNGVADSAPNVVHTGSTSIFSSLDVLTIGNGFIGHIRRFQIYSPGAFQVGSNTCDPTCAMHLGFRKNPICIQPICGSTSGTFLSFGSCEKCLTGCATCTEPTTCLLCLPGYEKEGTGCRSLFSNGELSEPLQDTLTTSQSINSAVTQVANIVSKGSSISLSAAISGKIFSQIKHLNISYSEELEVALLTWLPSFVSLGLTPNMPETMEDKIPNRHVPYVFEKYEVPSSFLINFWENLGIIIAATITWLLLKILEHVSNKSSSYIRKARLMAQNFLIASLYGSYGDLLMYSIVEYRTIKFEWNLCILSFIISVILLIVMTVSFCYQANLLANYQKFKKQGEENLQKFTKNHEGCQVIYKDFKDYSIAPQLFLFFLSARDIIFSLLLATMFEYPFVQILFFFLLTCLMMAYLFVYKPFESNFDLGQQFFFEIISLAVSITVLMNAMYDSGGFITSSSVKAIGKFIIICNLIFNFGSALLMLYIIYSSLKEAYNSYKEKAAKSRKVFELNCTGPQQSSFSASGSGFLPKINESYGMASGSNQRLPSMANSEAEIFHKRSSFDHSFNNPEPHQKLNYSHSHHNSSPLQCQLDGVSIEQQQQINKVSHNQPRRVKIRRPPPGNLSIPMTESHHLNHWKRGKSHNLNQLGRFAEREISWNFEEPQMPQRLKRR